MKNRLLSAILMIAMLISFLPISADAATYVNVTIGGICNYTEAATIANLTNEIRTEAGHSKLNYNASLTEAAMQRAAEIALYYDHTRPNGGNYNEVLKSYHTGAYYHGENIAIGQYSGTSAVAAWKASSGHYENMTATRYTQIGVGVYSSGNRTCYVQLFSDSKKDTASTTKTGLIDKTYTIPVNVDAGILLTKSSELTQSYELETGDIAFYSLNFYNAAYTYAYCKLIPKVSDIKDSSGKTIATLSTDKKGNIWITAVAAGTGTIKLSAFTGQAIPNELTVTVYDHTHSYVATVVAPTCKEQGYTNHVCNKCGDSYQDNYTETVAHTESEWIQSNLHATCTSSGMQYKNCIICNTVLEINWTPLLPHTNENWVSYDDTQHTGTCSECDQEVYEEHVWDEGTVKQAATYTQTGILTYSCIDCNETKETSIDVLENPFTDVTQGSYYYAPVLWALDNNITTGTTATTFSPLTTCTRAQVVTFLWRANGCPVVETDDPFTDTNPNAFYYQAMLWAIKNGITNGTSATTFSPSNPCTRAQVVTFLWRAKGTPAPETSITSFTDVNIDSYYYNAMLWAVENGITKGTSAAAFSPSANCKRAEIVTFLYRAMQ